MENEADRLNNKLNENFPISMEIFDYVWSLISDDLMASCLIAGGVLDKLLKIYSRNGTRTKILTEAMTLLLEVIDAGITARSQKGDQQ